MRRWTLLLFGTLMTANVRAADDAAARGRMVAEVRAMASQIDGRGGKIAPPVYEALGRVPRHAFMPEQARARAYENVAVPIGEGQTISQPYIVALMTDLVGAGQGARILEIGTGSGYQAAMLAEMGAEVFTIEIVPGLAERAARALAENGYGRVQTKTGDGYQGWPAAAPFDGIIVTAAPDHVPQPLTAQLKPGGRMVIPVGPQDATQRLVLIRKRADGTIAQETVIPVGFVPLTREK
ncbi:MAG: protein-L-isoaspartate(D-aspartate) O-methyltransferase [Rhodospirillaceae bacterium]